MDIYNSYRRMTFAELREYYKSLRFRQKMWYAIPATISVAAFLMACSAGWSYYPAVMSSHELRFDIAAFGIFDWLFTGAMILFLPYEKTERKFNYASPILMGAYSMIKLLFGIFNPLNFVMALYYLLAVYMLIPLHKEINFMRSLPDYPFPEHVELERQRELEARKYSENSYTNQKLIKKEEKQKAASMDELMQALPKRHIDPHKISRGEFDETEGDYTDKLIGEDQRDGYKPPVFDDPDSAYTEDFSTVDKLTMHRRDDIEEIDEGFEADFFVEPVPNYIDESEDVEEDEQLLLENNRISLEKNAPEIPDDGVS